MFDLGRYYRIWHPLIMRNPHSVMFEVAWCVMLYTTVLALEFAPIVFERLRLEKPLRILHAVVIPLVILGVLLSTLHQSSLGTLYLIMPEKLHPLWYTPLLPVFFFLSAIAVGLAMTIFESYMSSKHFHRQLELPLLSDLGRILAVVLSFYAVLRFEDLYHRGVLKLAAPSALRDLALSVEVVVGLLLPIAMLFTRRIRESTRRALPGGGADRAGLHHQPPEREHYRHGRRRRRALHPEVDGDGGDRHDRGRRLRPVRPGGQVPAHLPRGRRARATGGGDDGLRARDGTTGSGRLIPWRPELLPGTQCAGGASGTP